MIFLSEKKRNRQKNEVILSHAIEALEHQIAVEESEINFHTLNTELQAKKIELENVYAFQAKERVIY